MKILHTADWHFRERDYTEIKKCVDHILEEASVIEPDLILISGDITDSRYLNMDTKSARAIFNIISKMLDIAPVAIVIGTPSHDGHAALALRECRGNYPILISDMPEQVGYFDHDREWAAFEGAEIVPKFILTQIPQPTKQYFINDSSIEDTDSAISEAIGLMFTHFGHRYRDSGFDIPHIVNGHGQIGGAFISETQQLIGRDIEVSKTQLSYLDANLICYGHIHKSQEMGQNIFYSGSPTRMNFGEQEEKGFYVHELNRVMQAGIDEYGWFNESKFINTPARQMINIKSDYTTNEEMLSISEYMESMEDMPDNLYSGEDHIKFEIKAWQDDATQISASKIERLFKEAGAGYVKVLIVRVPRETVRAAKVLEVDSLPDKISAMAELRGEEVSVSILDKAKALEEKENEPWKKGA